MVESLRTKTDKIFIWCNADQFVHRHSLQGMYTGMFISEVFEAWNFKYWDNELVYINESNYGFSSIISKYLNEPVDVLYKNVIAEYGVIAKRNPIAKFNFERLYLSIMQPNEFADKVGKTLY